MITLEYYGVDGSVMGKRHPSSIDIAHSVTKYVLSDERHALELPHIFSAKITEHPSGQWELWCHTPGVGGVLVDAGDGLDSPFGNNLESFKRKYAAGGGYPK
jgi:hypothetical protein